MQLFKIKDEFIQLNQLIKAIGWVDNGGEANTLIEKGAIKVNGVTEYRKRNKLIPGNIVTYGNKHVKIE